MPTGVSHLYYPDQPAPAYPVKIDDSYFLLRIHDAQAFFSANILQRADYLLFSSSVSGSFQSTPMQSLYKATTIKSNTDCRLGPGKNLTKWLPARQTDKMSIRLEYTVTQGTPIKNLVDKMEELNLETVVSLIQPEIAIALTVSKIVGQLVSFFLQEGAQKEIFPLTMDLNLADLQTGYYAVLGSNSDQSYPNRLEIKHGALTAPGGHALTRYSYVVIEVLARPRLGLEHIRQQPWGELLLEAQDEALNASIRTDEERDDALQQWRINLGRVRKQARKEPGFLLREVDAVIDEAYDMVAQKLLSPTTPEAEGLDEYPVEWQEVLQVRDQQELRSNIRDYQDALALTDELLKRYQLR